MVLLQKGLFLNIFGKSKRRTFSGGHTGPPLQRYENVLNRDVGEHLCVLPQNNSRDDFFGDQSKKAFCSGIMLWEPLKGGPENKSKIIHGYKRFMLLVGAFLVWP